MNTPQFRLGFERKIGYSFVGLLAGNLAMLAGLLLTSLFRDYPYLAKLRHAMYLEPRGALRMWVWCAIFSLLGWAIVGVPAVLILSGNFVSRLHWLIAAVMGALLGIFALYLEIDRGRFDAASLLSDPTTFRQYVVFVLAAALNSGVAFTTYCTLAQWARLTHEIESGAPSSAPQSLSVF